jgi:heme exporter protein A
LLEADNISCTRGDRALFSGLSIAVESGQLLHVTGRNGSGKTTLLRTFCGLTRPASGVVRWRGQAIEFLSEAYRAELAYVAHANGIQGELTPPENLRLSLSLGGRVKSASVSRALERLGLAPYRSFPAKILSEGQKRRLALARLLLNHKPLWILDEPFSALDRESSHDVTGLITEHVHNGGLVVVTSHLELTLESHRVVKLALDTQKSARENAPGQGEWAR